MKLVILGRLASLNGYIDALDKGHRVGAALKRREQERVEWCIKAQLRGVHLKNRVQMAYTWYEPNQKRDMDNISSLGRKEGR